MKSNIIKGKIQHDQTFAVAAATANQFNLFNIAKLKQDCQKERGEREREIESEVLLKIKK